RPHHPALTNRFSDRLSETTDPERKTDDHSAVQRRARRRRRPVHRRRLRRRRRRRSPAGRPHHLRRRQRARARRLDRRVHRPDRRGAQGLEPRVHRGRSRPRPVVAGTGALSTAETIELTRDAKDAGADAVMVVPPFYDAPDFDALIAHYSAITEAVDIPIMYYNIPAATGVELSSQQLGELGRRTGVTSYTDTGGDFPRFTEVHFDEAEDIQALNGWDTLTFAAFALGARAGVWGAASVIPGLCAELYQAVAVDGDLARGRELWAKINPICVFL